MKKAVVFIGPPGSGKGTQAQIFAQKLGYFHFEAGRIGKDWMIKHPEHPLAKESMENYNKGGLFVPALMAQVALDEIPLILEKWQGVVFDGSARTLEEITDLWPVWLKLFEPENIIIFNINLSFKDAQERLAKRLICGQGHTYTQGVDGMEPGIACPVDGVPLTKRAMDDPEIMKKRFQAFEQETLPALEFLRQNHEVVEINGLPPIEQVTREIESKIREFIR